MSIRPGFVRFCTAVGCGVYLALRLSTCGMDNAPEYYSVYGAQVGECAAPGYVLASGVLDAAVHEIEDGYANVGGYGIAVRKDRMPETWFYVRQLRGEQVELVIRKMEPRTLKAVRR